MFKKLAMPVLASITLLTVGCTANEEAYDNENMENLTQPIAYETKNQANQRFQKNLSSEQKKNSPNEEDLSTPPEGLKKNSYTDGFYNKESKAVAEQLNKMEEIKMTQAFVTDEKIIVSVMINQEYDENVKNISDEVYRQVESISPNKKVIVYTDDIHWNRLRNLDARPNGSE